MMTRKEEINRIYGVLTKDYDNYIKAIRLYDAGWRKQIEAEWVLNRDGSGTCSNCHFTQRGVYDQDSHQRYCGCCGAKMKLGEK